MAECGLDFVPHCCRQAALWQSTASTAVPAPRLGTWRGTQTKVSSGVNMKAGGCRGRVAVGILERPREEQAGSLLWSHVPDDTQLRAAAQEVESARSPVRPPQLWHPRSAAELDWAPRRRSRTKDTGALPSV